jgi:deferrochelatase/peroxidase EfeB
MPSPNPSPGSGGCSKVRQGTLSDQGAEGRKTSRRELLRVAGATGAGLSLGAGGYAALRSGNDLWGADDEVASLPELHTVAFHGPYQAGVATQQQEHLYFASFDVGSEYVSEVRDLLRAWSEAGARMSVGRPAGEENESPFLPPDDTGEAFGLSPTRLTLTVGFGPTLFEKEGEDRLGLAEQRPAALAKISARCRRTCWRRRARAVTCACRRVPTTRSWPSTRSGTWRG